jgi:alkyldihydroxyacetonephosphate synthase
VTQTYDTCAACYFYFSFNITGFEHPLDIYEEIEEIAREEVLANGGSLSHHHGVGKVRKHLYPNSVSQVGVGLYKAAKQELDPNNIFAVGNIIDSEETDGHLVSKL